uniref:Uncharacterized protein n=1 Tax=Otolemur garnettii TaxID=30611 RepID=H0XJB0_OTOGA
NGSLALAWTKQTFIFHIDLSTCITLFSLSPWNINMNQSINLLRGSHISSYRVYLYRHNQKTSVLNNFSIIK